MKPVELLSPSNHTESQKQESNRVKQNRGQQRVRGINMQKLVSLAFSTLSTFSTTSQAFIQGHFRQTQRRVRREAVHGEPQVVNWEAASLEILQSATAYCAEGDEACDVEQLIDIKSALEGRAAGLEESAAAYADVVDCVEIKILRRVRAESSRRPPRHRRDVCSMAWRCRFLAARPSQDGRVVDET